MLVKNALRQLASYSCDREQKIYGAIICLTLWLGIVYLVASGTANGGANWLLGPSIEHNDRISMDLADAERMVLENDAELARAHNPNCSYWDCFDVYRCGEKLSIYVYPLVNYVEANDLNDEHGTMQYLSQEFFEVLKIIIESPFYTADPKEACIFVPSIDILNLNKAKDGLVAKALASLP